MTYDNVPDVVVKILHSDKYNEHVKQLQKRVFFVNSCVFHSITDHSDITGGGGQNIYSF